MIRRITTLTSVMSRFVVQRVRHVLHGASASVVAASANTPTKMPSRMKTSFSMIRAYASGDKAQETGAHIRVSLRG
jgi:hypothetical protein